MLLSGAGQSAKLLEPGFLAGAGAGIFTRQPTPTLQYFKYFVFTGPKYDYDDYD